MKSRKNLVKSHKNLVKSRDRKNLVKNLVKSRKNLSSITGVLSPMSPMLAIAL